MDVDATATGAGGGREIFEKLREVIRMEAAAWWRMGKCKGMDTHTKKRKSRVEILEKKKKVIPIKRLAKICEEIERGYYRTMHHHQHYLPP